MRHAARAVPWRIVGAASLLVPALVALAAVRPEALWPLQGVAVGLLAAVVAWSMDERAAAVVDTLPRALWWRTVARAVVVVPLGAVWVAGLHVAGDRFPDHTALFVLQGVAALAAGAAFATWRRAGGAATPGLVVAPTIVVATAVLALVRPVPERLPLFPIWDFEEWALSAAIWWGVLAGALGLLVAALTGGRPAGGRARA
jgi:hypothetical protein